MGELHSLEQEDTRRYGRVRSSALRIIVEQEYELAMQELEERAQLCALKTIGNA